MKNASGNLMYEYQLADSISNLRTAVAKDATVSVNNNATLNGVRWFVKDGVATRTASVQSAPKPPAKATLDGGYSYQLQDPGPDYGFSAEIVDVDNDGTVKMRVSNNYIRHGQVSVSFLAPDLKTVITVPDPTWLTLVKAATNDVVSAWLNSVSTIDVAGLVFDNTNQLKFLGVVSAEDTVLGVPVSSADSQFTFQLPTGQTIGKVRILCGSLGGPSGIDWDPKACWIGIGLTAFMDFLLPTISLITTAGEESDTLFDSILKDVPFLASLVLKIGLVVKDIVINPDMAGEDLKAFFIGLGDELVKKVLSAADVAAKLAAYFGAEEVEEAIPIVGWALKAEAIEATIEQLAQSIGEVAGSTRVNEFGLTVTMPVQITLTPSDASGFANTAVTYAVTAQYTDITGFVYDGTVPDNKTEPIQFTWQQMPVGGKVTFLVAFYSKEGWLVGQGSSANLDNFITPGQSALVVPDISVVQLLYPLDSDTTYGHQRVLGYSNGSHQWDYTTTAPAETARDLGSGSGGNQLEALTTIGLNSDLAILGYGFQATGQGVPLIGTTDQSQPIYTFQNIAFGSPSLGTTSQPEDGLMFTPAGYNASPILVYLRSGSADANDGVAGAQNRSFFFLDPQEDSVSSYHLRVIAPVNSSSIPANSPLRSFDLSTNMSWGRFRILPTSMAVHSTGCVVAVARGYSKLQILNLAGSPVPSANALWAQVLSGPGTREGLLSLPELVAIAPDQTIFVLEAGNMRIQAFSRGGHPIPKFPNLATPYWIPLYVEAGDSSTVTYVSMSVEIKGYIYVLSIEDNGYTVDQFRLDIYTPGGAHLFRQRGVNVASLTVDLWRNVYSLNYQMFQGPGGRTEPSVSEWIPSTPNTSNS
jgi:hypothetical protein